MSRAASAFVIGSLVLYLIYTGKAEATWKAITA